MPKARHSASVRLRRVHCQPQPVAVPLQQLAAAAFHLLPGLFETQAEEVKMTDTSQMDNMELRNEVQRLRALDGKRRAEIERLKSANDLACDVADENDVVRADYLKGYYEQRERIESLEKEVEGWKAVAENRVGQCETCDGDGVVIVHMDYGEPVPDDGDPEPCAECGGTGRGSVAFLIKMAKIDAAAEAIESLRKACVDV